MNTLGIQNIQNTPKVRKRLNTSVATTQDSVIHTTARVVENNRLRGPPSVKATSMCVVPYLTHKAHGPHTSHGAQGRLQAFPVHASYTRRPLYAFPVCTNFFCTGSSFSVNAKFELIRFQILSIRDHSFKELAIQEGKETGDLNLLVVPT